MNDFDKMNKNIGNRFDLILVASERLRELHAERKQEDESMKYSTMSAAEYLELRKRKPIPTSVAFDDIESQRIGREYLNKIKDRDKKTKVKKYDYI
jgi:DNA-directed RNA polymerase subunit K/omega